MTPTTGNCWAPSSCRCCCSRPPGPGGRMADVARWVDVQDVDDVAPALMEIGNQQALDAWAACTSRPDNTMGSVYGTAETLLDVFGDPVIAASAEGCDLDLDELLTGANNTLYLYAPASEQERLRPLFELLVSVVIYKAEQLAAAQPDGMLDPRLFVCLDEAGNCAAIKKLPQLATTGRGQGIQLLTIWHDEAQLPAPLRPPRRHRPERPSGQAAAVRPGRPGLPRAGQQAGRRRGRDPDLGDDRRGRPGVADRVGGVSAVVAAGGAAAAQAPAGLAGVWASAAGADPAAALVPLPPPGHPGHGGGRRRAAPGHGRSTTWPPSSRCIGRARMGRRPREREPAPAPVHRSPGRPGRPGRPPRRCGPPADGQRRAASRWRPSTSTRSGPRDRGRWQALAANREVVDQLIGWRWGAMREAREQGHGWAEIGTALGVDATQASQALPASGSSDSG